MKKHRLKSIKNVIGSLVIAGAPFSIATATTLYVDQGNPQCANTGPGTAETPYCTISTAALVAAAGDTVKVAAGTYSEQVTVKNSGKPGTPIVFTAAPGAAVTVTSESNGFDIVEKHWITVKGFTISNASSYGIYVKSASHITLSDNHVTRSGQPVESLVNKGVLWVGGTLGLANPTSSRKGIYLNNTTDSTVSRNRVDHNSDSGIYLVDGTTRVHVVGNVTSHNARGYPHAAAGIDLRSGGNTVEANVSHDNEDSGIQAYNGASNNLIVNNLCYRNGDHGIDVNSAPGQSIVGNTLHNNATVAINIEASDKVPSNDTTLANNVIVDDVVDSTVTRGAIRIDKASLPGTTVDYDLVFLSPENQVLIIWGGTSYKSLSSFVAATGMETHGIQAPPQWKAPASGNFHLTARSPAIDSANSGVKGALDRDLKAQPRADGPTTPNTGTGPRAYDDRGAFEYQPDGLADVGGGPRQR